MAPTILRQAGPALDSTGNTDFGVWRMRVKQSGQIVRSAWMATWIAASMLALTLGTAGCRARNAKSGPTATAPAGAVDNPVASANKLAEAGMSIVTACATEPFANASKGLIVAQTGLNEDVFDLRDRSTYRAVPFGLKETLRLQDLLLKEIDAPGHASYSAPQIACIRQFIAQFKSLTGPLVQADAEQKQLDVSAFDKASKEAEQVTEQQTEQEQKAITPTNSGQQ